MKKIISSLLFSICLIISFDAKAQFINPNETEKIVIERFEYIKKIKHYISDIYWKPFGAKDFEGTIVYFNDSASYFINPLEAMKEKVSTYSVLIQDYEWNIWKLKLPFDTAFFVMETTFQYDKKAKWDINYNTPVLFCSSPELTKKEKTEITSTEEWTVALMHELYHQYQYSNPAILAYVLRLYQEKKMIDMDSLQGIYLTNKMVNDTIKLENELLKKAYNATSIDEEKKIFKEFLKLRSLRNLAYFKKKKFYLTTPEDFWEKMEGTCLMMESVLKQNFTKMPIPEYLKNNDAMFKNDAPFATYSATQAVADYTELEDKEPYVGTTGYNMVRLLEKHNVNYKDNFFNYASLPLALQLKYFYKI